MSATSNHPRLDRLLALLEAYLQPFLGQPEYGSLRLKTTTWITGQDDGITNVAIVYETPGGSTDQINISYEHAAAAFVVVEVDGEHSRTDPEEVLDWLRPHVEALPRTRLANPRSRFRKWF